jgi:MFS transporter, ACS family, tartrate transporter
VTTLDRAISKAKGRLLPIVMICYFAAFLDRVNVGFAALQMNHDLGLTATAFGIGAGAFFITYVLCEIPSNLMLARFGARVWIARILLTWGLLSAATAFIWNAHSFYVARMLLGAAEAGFFPGMLFYLTQWFPRSHRARMTSTMQIAVPISTIIGAPLSALILQSLSGWLGFKGWQWLFIIEGMPAVVMSVVVFFGLPSHPQDAKWLTEEERGALLAQLAEDRANQERIETFTVWQALTDRRVLLMCLIGLGNIIGTTATALWMPQIIRTFGGTMMETGLLTAVPSIVALFALLLCGWNADRTGERVWHIAGPYLFASIGFVLAAFGSSPAVVLVGLIIGSAGITGGSPSVWALPAILLTGTASAAGLALINSVGSIGGFVGPFVIGWVRDVTGSFTVALLLMAGVLTATAFVVLVVGHLMRASLQAARPKSRSTVEASVILRELP